MPNQSNHKGLVYYSTSNSVFSVLTVIMFKCVSNSETLAHSTVSACGQRVDFITQSEQKRGKKNNFSTVFQHTPFIIQCPSFGLHRVAPETQHQSPLVSNLNLKCIQLPVTEFRRLSVSSSTHTPPPHAPNLGRQASLPIVLVVFETSERVRCCSLRLLRQAVGGVEEIRLEDSSQATSQYSKVAGSAAKDRTVRNTGGGM